MGKLEVQKDGCGHMVRGWYRDLYETQHGKGDESGEAEKLRKELANAKKQVWELREENCKLKGAVEVDDVVRKRALTGDESSANQPPPPFLLRRVRTSNN